MGEGAEVVGPEGDDFAEHVLGEAAEGVGFLGGYGVGGEGGLALGGGGGGGALVGHFDAREVVEVGDGEDARHFAFGENEGGVFDAGIGVEAFGVEEDGVVGDAELEGTGAHGFGFVDGAVGGAAGHEDEGGEAGAVEIAAGADAVFEGGREGAVSVGAGAEDNDDVGLAAVIGFAEADHLGEGEEDGAEEHGEEDSDDVAELDGVGGACGTEEGEEEDAEHGGEGNVKAGGDFAGANEDEELDGVEGGDEGEEEDDAAGEELAEGGGERV